MGRGILRGGPFLPWLEGCVESGLIDGVRALENAVVVPHKPDWREPSKAGPRLL